MPLCLQGISGRLYYPAVKTWSLPTFWLPHWQYAYGEHDGGLTPPHVMHF